MMKKPRKWVEPGDTLALTILAFFAGVVVALFVFECR
jgi:hypothetical protein